MLERSATHISEYHPILIPGPLQTAGYAQALVTARQVGVLKERIEKIVKIRIERLPAIVPKRPVLWYVVDEIVATRVIGNETVMKEQLAHLVSLATAGTIRFQVIPGDVRMHCGLCSPFRLPTLASGQTVVFMEHTFGGTVFDRPDQVRQMATLFGALQAEALSPSRSIDLVRTTLGGLG